MGGDANAGDVFGSVENVVGGDANAGNDNGQIDGVYHSGISSTAKSLVSLAE